MLKQMYRDFPGLFLKFKKIKLAKGLKWYKFTLLQFYSYKLKKILILIYHYIWFGIANT